RASRRTWRQRRWLSSRAPPCLNAAARGALGFDTWKPGVHGCLSDQLDGEAFVEQAAADHFAGPACGPKGEVIALALGCIRNHANKAGEGAVVRHDDAR